MPDFTAETLKEYDGSDPSKLIYMALKNRVFNVTALRSLFGPGGRMAMFAGKNPSRALAEGWTADSDIISDLRGLSEAQIHRLNCAERAIEARCPVVGRFLEVACATEPDLSSPHTHKHTGEKVLEDFTAETLKEYDGSDPSKLIYMALKDRVFNVTAYRSIFGPGGGMAMFAGKNPSRNLAEGWTADSDIISDLRGLSEAQIHRLNCAERAIEARCPVVGRFLEVACATEPDLSSPHTHKHTGEKVLADFTETTLKVYDGSDPSKPIYMALKNRVFDVTTYRSLFGPGGRMAKFAGKNPSRAVAKRSKADYDLIYDLRGLSQKQIGILNGVERVFEGNCPVVGRFLSSPHTNKHTLKKLLADFTAEAETLKEYDCSPNPLRLTFAELKNRMLGVTTAPSKLGPGDSWAMFAGRSPSSALAKVSKADSDVVTEHSEEKVMDDFKAMTLKEE